MKSSLRPFMVAIGCAFAGLVLSAAVSLTGPSITPTKSELIAYYGAQSVAYKLPVAQQTSHPVVPSIQGAFNATVVMITPEGRLIGTGVILEHKKGKVLKILTAWHVAKVSFPQISAVGLLYSGEVIPVQTQKFNEAWDLALMTSLIVEDEDGPATTMAAEEPVLGEDVWVIGHPRGLIGNVTKGVLSNILHADKDLRYYRIDAATFFGNSGGGLFNSKGELIGIADALEFQIMFKDQATIVPGGALCISLYNLKLFVGG